jgi:hypothetical protein
MLGRERLSFHDVRIKSRRGGEPAKAWRQQNEPMAHSFASIPLPEFISAFAGSIFLLL